MLRRSTPPTPSALRPEQMPRDVEALEHVIGLLLDTRVSDALAAVQLITRGLVEFVGMAYGGVWWPCAENRFPARVGDR